QGRGGVQAAWRKAPRGGSFGDARREIADEEFTAENAKNAETRKALTHLCVLCVLCGEIRRGKMADITASMIKDLRERTGSGMSDCKKALHETAGDMEKAVEYLRKKGLAAAAKKSGRIAAEGRVFSYVHAGGRIAVLVEINCETDFVAKTEDFERFGKDVAMQIAAMNPQFVSEEEIPSELVEKERAIRSEQARTSGKPDAIIAKMVDGQISKWKKEIVLLDQAFVKADKKDTRTLLTELVAKIGENCKIRRFARYEVGEGLEKRKDDFAAEVRAQAGL